MKMKVFAPHLFQTRRLSRLIHCNGNDKQFLKINQLLMMISITYIDISIQLCTSKGYGLLCIKSVSFIHPTFKEYFVSLKLLVLVEKKSMGGEMSFRPLVRPHHSFTLLFSHPGDKL
jgi:hypothetical protein